MVKAWTCRREGGREGRKTPITTPSDSQRKGIYTKKRRCSLF
jgi:hypothetical protein